MNPFSGAGTPFDWVEAIGHGRAPLATLVCGPGMCTAGPNGVAVGCFGWVDPDVGQVTNQLTQGYTLGLVLPVAGRYNLWERVYIRNGLPFPQMIIRPGVACVVAVVGDFKLKFPGGGELGSQVYADTLCGLPLAGPSVVLDNDGNPVLDSDGNEVYSNCTPTSWTLMQSGPPNARLRISSFVSPLG